MTSLAIRAKAAMMNVISPVAGHAFLRSLCGIARTNMASAANQPLMPAGQGEVCLHVMIEIPALPVRTGMTGGAGGGLAQHTLVMIINMARLARDTLGRKTLVRVALLARQRAMLADQWKTGQFMIKADARKPAVT